MELGSKITWKEYVSALWGVGWGRRAQGTLPLLKVVLKAKTRPKNMENYVLYINIIINIFIINTIIIKYYY